ncbi:MAG TPA: M20/M25/M40 family metallo-hydrolase [Enhygromyxa sp.]|nr:M20/M25/M40 family metallo-hydrolase [Enhygromyxa sp.]
MNAAPWSALALFGLALAACRPEAPSEAPVEQPVAEVETPVAEPPSVDAQAMFASIEWLASDERQGRYTLAPEIEQVASWIAERHAELGLEPVRGAESMRLGYPLRTKVEAGDEQTLIVERKGKPTPVDAKHFTPRAEGVAGTAKAEVVFVGYGVSWTRPEDDPNQDPDQDVDPQPSSKRIDSYDDLAGVDLTGKIALCFAHAPNTPDYMALMAEVQRIGEEFEAAAAPLRDTDQRSKLEKLHRKAREQLVDLVAPFVDTKDLGDAYWKVEDPKAGLDIMGLASVFLTRTQHRPQFADPRELSFSKKAERLAAAGAVGVIFVEGPRSILGDAARKAAALPGVIDAPTSAGTSASEQLRVIADPAPIPVVQLRWTEADKLFALDGKKLSQIQAAIDTDYQPRSQALGVSAELTTDLHSEQLEVPNVLAQIRGETDEIIMLGAHFDHIGSETAGHCRAVVKRETRDPICNGADDNASGTAMLLELARVYKQSGITPKRTLVFAHFSGEELGLLGSRALIESSPFDQGEVVAMVNLDMVGRLGPHGLAIGGIYSSNDWLPLLDELGNYGMRILYEGSTTTRSDHAWWFRRQIPVLFFFTGVHPDYHRAGDELDEINVDGLGKIGELVSDLVWALASGRSIQWSAPPNGDGIGRGLPGTDRSTVIREVGEDGNVLASEG